MLPQPVTVRRSDFRIRVHDICRASSQPKTKLFKIKREFKLSFDTVFDFNYRDIYVNFWVGVELYRRYGLTELEEELRTWKGVPQEPVKEPELSEFIEITGFPSPIMVRRSDFRVNASHIAKLTGHSRHCWNWRNTILLHMQGCSQTLSCTWIILICALLCATVCSLGEPLR